MASPAARRLATELRDWEGRDKPDELLARLGPVRDEDLFRWQAVLRGVPGSAYEGGQWLLSIDIPSSYPSQPPDVKFVTPICHPNINFTTGEICLDLLRGKAWTPAYTIYSALEAVQHLLTITMDPDSPFNVDVAGLYRMGDGVAAEALARFYTDEYRAD